MQPTETAVPTISFIAPSNVFHASVAALISSPTFFGDKPKGPTLGAKLAAAPISPPTVLRITKFNYYLF